VVRDQKGRVVSDLKKDDFLVFDNGKEHAISAFTVEQRGVPRNSSETVAQVAHPSLAQQASPGGQRFIVFLFDDMHLSAEDLARAKKSAVKAIDGKLTASDLAVVVSTGGTTNSGFTLDRAKLREAIMSLRTRSLYRADGNECPKIDDNLADSIENKHDINTLEQMIDAVLACNPGMNHERDRGLAENLLHSADNRVLNLSRQDVRVADAAIFEFVRRMAALPGERILILASPGFTTTEPEARTAETRIIDLAVQSNITINTLNARGVSVAGPDPYAAQEGLLAELAYGTGGTFFHGSNDLDVGFETLTEAPEVAYVLELPLDGVKADGSNHRLQVKVNRPGLEVQTRRGYSVPRPEKTRK
jgi:VWFA-related protein